MGLRDAKTITGRRDARMTDRRTTSEMAALTGADQLTDQELGDLLAELAGGMIVPDYDNPHDLIQDLHELAAIATVLARRLERDR